MRLCTESIIPLFLYFLCVMVHPSMAPFYEVFQCSQKRKYPFIHSFLWQKFTQLVNVEPKNIQIVLSLKKKKQSSSFKKRKCSDSRNSWTGSCGATPPPTHTQEHKKIILNPTRVAHVLKRLRRGYVSIFLSNINSFVMRLTDIIIISCVTKLSHIRASSLTRP